ncbi:MAG: glycosyltransferase family 4 protein [Bacteroidia bacterium]|nr:glycosyltransferase family 4 protein [Bacteroidia bacterium]
MKKVLLVVNEFPPVTGGVAAHAFQLAEGLSNIGHTLRVVTFQQKVRQGSFYQVVCTGHKGLFRYLNRFFTCFRAVLSFKPDVIIASNKFPVWVGYCLKLFFPGKQFIAVLHGNELLQQNYFAKRFTEISLNKFDKLVAVSSYTASLLKPHQRERCDIILNALDVKWLKGENRVKTFSGKLNLLTVGTVRPRKGHANIIRALPVLAKGYPEVNYTICGAFEFPVYVSELKTLADSLGVAQRIRFVQIPYSDFSSLHTLYKECDIYLLLSETQPNGDTEGFGISILEANSCGTPAIGAKQGGTAEAVKDSKSGRLITPQNTSELLHAVEEIVKHYESYSLDAQARAAQFTKEKMARSFEDLFY